MSYISIPTSLRAVFNLSLYSLSRIKHFSAIGTSNRATGITNLCGARSRNKLIAAFTTLLQRNNNRERTTTNQFRVSIPKLLLGNAVTGRAQGNQIIQAIRFSIITEQSKRPNVMNRITFPLGAATLAGIVIPLPRCFALAIPVWPAILRMPSPPRSVFTTANSASNRPPFVIALAAAKVTAKNLTRHALNFGTAEGARNPNTFATAPFMVFGLPRCIALETAKRIFGQSDMIPSALDRLSTFGAMYCNHAFNYTTSGLSLKGALRNG